MTLLDETRLSTAPAPVPPPARTTLGAVRRTWRQLTSMRTALLLLFLLALAAVPGSFLPQRDLNPIEVQEFFDEHPSLAPFLDRLSAFDVYASPWFSAVYLLLFVSLIGCLGPRLRLHARALRKPPPKVPASLSRLPVSDRWETDEPDPLARAEKVLRRWRTVRRGDGLSAERGYLRETGNLLFHISLVVLLLGIAQGAFYGFKGTVLVREGDGFANAVLNFDDITPGRRFDQSTLVPFHFVLEDFRATYRDTGEALTFDADVQWAPDADSERRPYDVRVNHPLAVGVAKTYLIGHGYSVKVTVRDPAGNVAMAPEDAVPCLPQNPQFLSTCVIKVKDPQVGEQLAFEGVFTPTTVQGGDGRIGSAHPAVDRPALTVVGYRGNLGLDAGIPGSVYQLDKERLDPLQDGRPKLLTPGETWALPGGGSITFDGVAEWATFQVTQDPGKHVALVASVGMVLGLCLSLFVRRRRVWVRALPAEGGRTVVEVGGLARSDSDAFAREFAGLARELRGLPREEERHG